MAKAPGTFSESWFRIANQRISLRPHVEVRRQRFRGERWFVLEDPFNNQFFRVRPVAWSFLVRLTPDRTVESVWQECFDERPDEAPGQEEVIRLLAQLYSANLLHSDLAPDTAKLFERYRKRKQRETRAYLKNIMFARVPLLDPDNFLKTIMSIARICFSWFGALVWIGVVIAALKLVADRFPDLQTQSQGILATGNLFWLYVALVLIKTIHEFGHAIACRRYGGEVHTMGVMFLLFTPIPYMDATSSWAFRSRWHRALVGGAGMIVEVFVAAIATFVWANTGQGVINSVAYNMMFIASVSTLLFNANPLLRFDGYYILSDLLDIPNLHQRGTAFIRHLWEKHVFGIKDTQNPARSRKEAAWLGVFSVSSNIYRVFVFAAILVFVADRFLILGVLMAVACVISWVIIPIGKLVVYLASSPKLERTRPRALMIVGAIAAALIVLLDVIPFPHRFRAPGVVQAVQHSVIVPDTGGIITAVLTPNGSIVEAGQPLIELTDRELDLQIQSAEAELAQSRALELRALEKQTADLKPIATRVKAVKDLLASLHERRDALIVRAPHAGRWIAPDIANLTGSWLVRGAPVGEVINESGTFFTAIVSQEEASRLFTNEIAGSAVRMKGQAGEEVPVTNRLIVPAERQSLPSAALGWRGGGEVPVELQDDSGVKASEPFFEVRATLDMTPGVSLLQGRSGYIRFDLPAEPLLPRWIRKLRQILQNRYGI
jgi:putative peptide zinc metalloprotease protein